MYDFTNPNGVIVFGEGALAVPEEERTLGRWGSVYLTDLDGAPVPLHGIPAGVPIALTATLLPDHDRIHLPDKRELLGAGYAVSLHPHIQGAKVTAVGAAPPEDRTGPWLFEDTLRRLTGRRVRLEAHLAARPPKWMEHGYEREAA